MLRKEAFSQKQRLCTHLKQLQFKFQEGRASSSPDHSTQAVSNLAAYVSSQHASTAAQFSRDDQTAGPRLDIDAPTPRFVPQSGLPQAGPSARQPIGVQQAIDEVKANAKARFDETIEIAINLGTNPKRGDQAVRGTALLPFGTGKAIRIAAFAEGEDATAATAAGADIVGGEDLVQQIQTEGSSSLHFDKAVAVPAMMPKLSKIARLLGPRGLMPNPKLGTLSTDIKEAIRLLKTGKVEFRADRGAVLHAGLGKASFSSESLQSNLGALCSAILNVRPKGVKGSGTSGYFISAHLSSTMGRSVPVSVSSLSQAMTSHKASQR